VSAEQRSRREFLRLTAAAATAGALGVACGSGSDKPRTAGTAGTKGVAADGQRTLRIAQWSHFIPAYDAWFDQEYTRRWGEEHGVEVVVDHLPFAQLRNRADAEVAAQRGHDIFSFITPPPVFEDDVIDHRDLVTEVEARVGKMSALVERSVLNPRTGRYFGFPGYWVANPVHYRADLWSRVAPALRPDTWDDVRRAAPKLKALGHPLGIGVSSDLDSAMSLPALMLSYGSSIQDETGNLVINTRATVQAVEAGAAIFRSGMTDEVFSWDAASDNRFLAAGKGSLILDALSAMRAVEKEKPELAGQIALAPVPAGPGGRLSPHANIGVFVIWKFSANQELAKQFLVDLALNGREAFLRSEFYNLPAFPGTVPDLAELLASDPQAQPPAKYGVLAAAAEWSTNLGHPGHSNAAVDEVINEFLIPKMFANAARGDMSAEEAVRAAEAQIRPIFEKWRERGKV
jgi:multiple sugar transport system substrate-binding protein